MAIPLLPDAGQSTPVEVPTEREPKCPFNPPSELGELRAKEGVSRIRYPDGHLGWLVTSHELARVVLGDARFTKFPGGTPKADPGRAPRVIFEALQRETGFPDAVRDLVDRYRRDGQLIEAFRDPEVVRALHEHPLNSLSFLFMDQPEHDRLRRAVTGYFSVRRVGEHRALIERIVSNCLDAMERQGPPVDLVKTFTLAVPTLVACELFGLAESDRETFVRLGADVRDVSLTLDDAAEAEVNFWEWGRDLVERKRAQPATDLLGELVHSGKMTDDELMGTIVNLVRASNRTVANTCGVSVATLLQDRDLWEVLRAESAPIGQIVEEMVRHSTVIQNTEMRTALEDVELGGTLIKAFENVTVSLSAANRDPLVFPEPDRVDFTRQATQHLTFGSGVHQCLGQHQARLELQIMLTGLARRFPNLALAVPVEDIPWNNGDPNILGPRELRVTWQEDTR